MISNTTLLRAAMAGAALLFSLPAQAADDFPFGLEMTLDAQRMPGNKRIPNLEIGDAGEAMVELWCKGGKGQFSIAGNTVVFVPGTIVNRNCTEAQIALDDQLLADLGAATNWQRRGDTVTFIGPKTLRFRLNTN
ncbi:META domain-containing protein [Tardiphaga alba]|uniref:META domain-containing protein n=1 Tax=Tardiphaga alba TaxID=340268 RepID=A0ABX8ACM1_9BRAD|nr:META domain-containing protein [Tardiphaga alba]QUS41304.1 META domain-containing protein [Tardiphaga alba]